VNRRRVEGEPVACAVRRSVLNFGLDAEPAKDGGEDVLSRPPVCLGSRGPGLSGDCLHVSHRARGGKFANFGIGVEGEPAEVLGDGAYDFHDCYKAIRESGARAVIPPQVRARGRVGDEFGDLNAAVLRGRGVSRDEWKKEAGYHRRGLAETAMMRLKTIFSDKLKAGGWKRRVTKLRVRCAAMNRMTSLGMPQSYAV
jgi:hypothetical protein